MEKITAHKRLDTLVDNMSVVADQTAKVGPEIPILAKELINTLQEAVIVLKAVQKTWLEMRLSGLPIGSMPATACYYPVIQCRNPDQKRRGLSREAQPIISLAIPVEPGAHQQFHPFTTISWDFDAR